MAMTGTGTEAGARGTAPGEAGSGVLWTGRVLGAGLLVWMGWIHLHLWSEGYKHIHTVGPMFMANFVAAMVLAIALLAVPSRELIAAAAAAGAALAVATLGGLALSVNVGLFGFTDSWNAPFAHLSLGVEIAAAAALLATAAWALAGRVTAGQVTGHARSETGAGADTGHPAE